MLKLSVKDFQSIAEAEIEISGFTVVTGSSNVGKSALVRAFRGALRGIRGDHYVRSGTNASEVEIQDGVRVLWRKVKKKRAGDETKLTVTRLGEVPDVFTRMGVDHPDATASLGFDVVEAGGLKVWPQIASQYDPPGFLLADAYTPGTVADVFKSLGQADVVGRACSAAKKDLTQTKTTLGVHQTDLEAAQLAAAEMVWVLTKRVEFDQIRDDVKAKEEDAEGVLELASKIEALDAIRLILVPLDPGHKVRALEAEYDRLMGLFRKIETLKGLAPTREIPVAPDLTPCEEALLATLALELSVGELIVARPTDAVEKLDVEVWEALEEQASLEEQLGTCPTCGKEFECE